MVVDRWQPEALDCLIEHDIWRMGQGWEPVSSELIRAIEAYFEPLAPERPPWFLPGRPTTLAGEHGTAQSFRASRLCRYFIPGLGDVMSGSRVRLPLSYARW